VKEKILDEHSAFCEKLKIAKMTNNSPLDLNWLVPIIYPSISDFQVIENIN